MAWLQPPSPSAAGAAQRGAVPHRVMLSAPAAAESETQQGLRGTNPDGTAQPHLCWADTFLQTPPYCSMATWT